MSCSVSDILCDAIHNLFLLSFHFFCLGPVVVVVVDVVVDDNVFLLVSVVVSSFCDLFYIYYLFLFFLCFFPILFYPLI